MCCTWCSCNDRKENGCLKLMKDDNPEFLLGHCVILRESLVVKNIPPALNEGSNKMYQHYQSLCCVFLNRSVKIKMQIMSDYCFTLKRFMELFDILTDF